MIEPNSAEQRSGILTRALDAHIRSGLRRTIGPITDVRPSRQEAGATLDRGQGDRILDGDSVVSDPVARGAVRLDVEYLRARIGNGRNSHTANLCHQDTYANSQTPTCASAFA